MLSVHNEYLDEVLLALFDYQYIDYLFIKQYILYGKSKSYIRKMIHSWAKNEYIQIKYTEHIDIEGVHRKTAYALGSRGKIALLSLVDESVPLLDEDGFAPHIVVHQLLLAHTVEQFKLIKHERIQFVQAINERWSFYQYIKSDKRAVIRPDFQIVMRVYNEDKTKHQNIAYFIELERARSRGKKNRDKLKRYQKFLERKGYKDGEGDIYDDVIHNYVVSFIVAAPRVNLERIKLIAQEKEFYYMIDNVERRMPVQVISHTDVFTNITGQIVQSIDGSKKSMFGI